MTEFWIGLKVCTIISIGVLLIMKTREVQAICRWLRHAFIWKDEVANASKLFKSE